MSRSTLVTVYLYGDGHAVEYHEQHHQKSGTTARWVEVYEKWGPRVQFACFEGCDEKGNQHGPGRLIVGSRYARGLVSIIKRATYVATKGASVEQGSSKTQELGLRIGHVEVGTTQGSLSFLVLPDVLSNEFTYQPEASTETWADVETATEWSDYRIAKKVYAKKQEGAAK